MALNLRRLTAKDIKGVVADRTDASAIALMGSALLIGHRDGEVIDIVYLAHRPGGLHVFDTTDPSHVREIGYHVHGDHVFDVRAAGDAVYLADRFGGLQIFDRADWLHP